MTTRRGLFGWLVGGAIASQLPAWAWGKKPLAVKVEAPEGIAITRVAFVPRVVVQTYNAGPMLSMINPGKGYTSAPTITVVGEPDGP